jgi:hypothetical protein
MRPTIPVTIIAFNLSVFIFSSFFMTALSSADHRITANAVREKKNAVPKNIMH